MLMLSTIRCHGPRWRDLLVKSQKHSNCCKDLWECWILVGCTWNQKEWVFPKHIPKRWTFMICVAQSAKETKIHFWRSIKSANMCLHWRRVTPRKSTGQGVAIHLLFIVSQTAPRLVQRHLSNKRRCLASHWKREAFCVWKCMRSYPVCTFFNGHLSWLPWVHSNLLKMYPVLW